MNALHPRTAKLLDDILVSSKRIIACLQKESLESFVRDSSLDVQDIIARRLIVIGEASAALLRKDPEFCEANLHIPLRQARGLRNVLVHEYDEIDWQAVWYDCQRELPVLVDAITTLFQENQPTTPKAG